jgi:hypothetical protein
VVGATNCSLTDNEAYAQVDLGVARGGAIRNESGQVILERCTFVGNRALCGAAPWGTDAAGGAIHNSGALAVNLCTFTGNFAIGGNTSYYGPGIGMGGKASGGAVFSQGAFTADQSTFSNNFVGGGWGASGGGPGGDARGGAVCNAGALSISRSAIFGNGAGGGNGNQGWTGGVFMDQGQPGGTGGLGGFGDGGALFNSGTASLINCTITGNQGSGGGGGAGGQGGGGNVRWGGQGGSGGSGGNGLGGVDGTCNLTNCTLALNGGSAGPGGPGGPGGTGLIGQGGPGAPGPSGTAWGGTVCSTLVNTLIASNTPAGNDSFTDPKLGPLADNGGPTLTMALLPGSPAIDAGDDDDAPPTDQRGHPRPVGIAADIGAYEYGSTPRLRISPPQAGAVEILLHDLIGPSCRLLSSTNLSEWQCVATNQIAADGTALFHVNVGLGETRRFYQVASP